MVTPAGDLLTLISDAIFYLPPTGDINLHHVCGCVCHAVFSKTITVRHFLLKKSPIMNFHTLEYFFGFIHFELTLSE